ncbi:Alg9-like mannosyltransferase family-domain-containing protein [Dimargaris cristalligena]|uniref:Mannosyltransferase n=1 Tax=Dimargaris cristalligena TaxID=215637 RepID=A0A4Q0A2H1_9FUNG|nr:Alg9-like mannosyltransferase family-domain-containing protein [Dimargaris cristalligena]|eukprot:RKP40313.1 Alg9-like mannosyltransferase family-domain-containing protein [Dimargaris cristalligena]
MVDSIYLTLASLRFVAALLPGYIHPDEFFQTVEIAAGSIAHYRHSVPWEFDAAGLPSRSIVPVYLLAGVPFTGLNAVSTLAQALGYQFQPAPYTVLYAERLWATVLSFIVDYTVGAVLAFLGVSARRPLRLLASSFVVGTFLIHTFTNSLETILLCLATLVLLSLLKSGIGSVQTGPPPSQPPKWPVFAFGVIMALGLFTRITFAAFAIPFAVYFLYLLYHPSNGPHSTYRPLPVRVYQLFFVAAWPCLLGFLVTVLSCLVSDSAYFYPPNWSELFVSKSTVTLLVSNPKQLWTLLQSRVVITPLNNLLYNMDPDNLAQHGLHPKYLHILEPRFLLPLLPSLVAICAPLINQAGPWFWRVWAIFNGVLLITFGGLHQAGIIPALQFIQTTARTNQQCHPLSQSHQQCRGLPKAFTPLEGSLESPSRRFETTAVFYKTLMPMPHLLAMGRLDTEPAWVVNVVDLAGKPRSRFMEFLDSGSGIAPVPDQATDGSAIFKCNHTAHLCTRSVDWAVEELRQLKQRSAIVYEAFPHVNFDDLGLVLQSPATRSSLVVRQLHD